MSQTVDFIFDFASPNAYLCHQVVGQIEQRTGATFDYIPCLLGGIFKATGNQPPMLAFANIKNKAEYEGLEMRRFIDRHRLDRFQMNPHFPVMTLQIMRGAVAARQDGYLAEYIGIVLKALWEDGLKMDDPEVIRQTFVEGGLNADKLMTQMQQPDIKAQLIANTEQAVQRGAFGVPTFFVGGTEDMFFGKERLGQVEELLLA